MTLPRLKRLRANFHRFDPYVELQRGLRRLVDDAFQSVTGNPLYEPEKSNPTKPYQTPEQLAAIEEKIKANPVAWEMYQKQRASTFPK